MPVPLALTLPALATIGAYINAKGSLTNDLRLLDGLFGSLIRIAYRQRNDQISAYYLLEGYAQSKSHADKDLIIFEGKHYTYAQSYERILRYGTWFKETLGIQKGDIVAMDYQNSDNFIFLWFGLWSIGAKPAFINYNLTGNALAHCIKVSDAKLCIVDPPVEPMVTDAVRESVPHVTFLTFTPDVEAQACSAHPTRYPNEMRSVDNAADMAMLIYTSGTTGLPKPAIVSHYKVITGGNLGHRIIGVRSSDIVYTSMPLYHSAASVLSFSTVLHAGATQAIGRKFSTRNFWDECRATNATVIQYVGETLRYLLVAPPQVDPVTGENLDRKHNVRMAYGNGLRPDIWDRFKDRFGIDTIGEFYAATEGTSALINVSSNKATSGAIGRSGWIQSLLMKKTVAIVELDWDTEQPKRDPDTGLCIKVQPGQPGELLFLLPADDPSSRFQGYWKNPSANEKKLIRDVAKKGDVFFRTGDAIRWDSQGLFHFMDRLGDTFRWKSENVSTAEVSQAVGTHPSVREANVYGVQLPNHDGRAGCAVINLDPAAPPLEETLRSLAAHARAELPRYAVPLFLRVTRADLGATQATGTNKQQKTVLRKAGVKPDESLDKEYGELFWLSEDTYVPFSEKEWKALEVGQVKL